MLWMYSYQLVGTSNIIKNIIKLFNQKVLQFYFEQVGRQVHKMFNKSKSIMEKVNIEQNNLDNKHYF